MKQSLWHCTLSCNIFNGDHMQVFFFFFFFFSWNFTVQNTDVLIHFYQWLPNFPKDRMQQERLRETRILLWWSPGMCVLLTALFLLHKWLYLWGHTCPVWDSHATSFTIFNTVAAMGIFSFRPSFVRRPSRGCIFCAWSCYLRTVNVLVGHELGTKIGYNK